MASIDHVSKKWIKCFQSKYEIDEIIVFNYKILLNLIKYNGIKTEIFSNFYSNW